LRLGFYRKERRRALRASVERHQLEITVSDVKADASQSEIEMLEAKEMWSEYRLADGTRLRIRPVIIAVFRANGEVTADGEPAYNIKSTLITDVRAAAGSAQS